MTLTNGRLLCLYLGFACSLSGAAAAPLAHVVLPAAVSADGRTRLFGTNINPDGSINDSANLFLQVQGAKTTIQQLTHIGGVGDARGNPIPGVTAASLTPDGSAAAWLYQSPGSTATELHVTNTAAGTDLRVAMGDSFATPHISPDGKSVLYATPGDHVFALAASNGSGAKVLPVYTAALAPAWQRVIANNGTVVFTSAAPFGPTFAAAAVNVYVMNLDGTGIRQVTHFPNDPATISRNATISADGLAIAFESNFDPARNGPGLHTRIYTIGVDGFGLNALTDGSSDAAAPSLSANGKTLLFTQGGAVWQSVSGGAPAGVLGLRWSLLQDPVVMEDGLSFVSSVGPSDDVRGAIAWFDILGVTRSLVYAPRILFADGIVGAAGLLPAAGGLISVYGYNLGQRDELLTPAGFPLPFSLGDLTLLANGSAVPLLAVSPWQVNAQLPPDLALGNVAFQIAYAGGAAIASVKAEVRGVSGAVFVIPGPEPRQAAALHAGTGILVDAAHPAAAGETVEVYGTGFGATDLPVPPGLPAPDWPPALVLNPVAASIGDMPAAVTFAGLSPGLAGVYQVNVVVPPGLPPGTQSLTLQSAGFHSLPVTMAVK
jgi:uncharacterized protein (TIGR03437 family)